MSLFLAEVDGSVLADPGQHFVAIAVRPSRFAFVTCFFQDLERCCCRS